WTAHPAHHGFPKFRTIAHYRTLLIRYTHGCPHQRFLWCPSNLWVDESYDSLFFLAFRTTTFLPLGDDEIGTPFCVTIDHQT
ncbi:MAG: hypothetical protein KDD70_18785, partial [Bdellovibrionales bacterium]|nr:hypothetical protein [Bdellovibrionales bacterium]